jgi:hypothetical protein
MKTTIRITLLLLSSGLMSAQDTDTGHPMVPRTECSSNDPLNSGVTRSCRMFNEMLAAGNKEFSDFQSEDQAAYVCFEADEFLVLTFSSPTKEKWKMGKVGEEQDGLSTLKTFRNGALNQFIRAPVIWRRSGDEIYAGPPKPSITTAVISSAEVSFLYPFKNSSESTVIRNIAITRSTLSFVDKLVADGKPELISETGICSAYPK